MDINSDTYIACMCEGGAEAATINILLDNDLLWFSRAQLLDGGALLRRCKVRDFEKRYLRQAFSKKIIVIRVLDSKGENFKLKAAYQHQVDKIVDIITAPEIEILVIIAQGKYQDFQGKRHQHKKPSDYCKQVLKLKDVKKPEFISGYFSDVNKLLAAIREYDRLHRKEKGELSLSALLKTIE
ncbi:MAG: hypothetical protein Q4C56_04010 [Peptococcaceae bacterium]|nr:hypothetical protein [Peptococcaceae bacterium]